jgi:epoxide hydrolase-like predicted phosphatase
MIKAVIFDCFGVLTGDGWLPFKRKYFGHDRELLLQATDLNKQADAGLISYEEFLESVAELANIDKSAADQEIEDNIANNKLFDYIETLSPKYKIGMLSNAADDWLEHMFSPKQRRLFDTVVLSYETGIVKPDQRAYEIIAQRLGVDCSECLFIDDQERYCLAANDSGMKSVWFQNTEQTINDLKRIL